MSVNDSMTAIANAIRSKTGSSAKLTLSAMPAAINSISTGGGGSTPPSVEQATPTITVSSSGLITASATQSAGTVSAGTKTATKQLTTQAAKTVTPGTNSQTAVASGVYTTGAVTVAGDTNLIASNIVSGKTIFGVSGSHSCSAGAPKLQAKTVTPTTSQQVVKPDSGNDGLSQVTVNAIPSNYVVPSGTMSITSNGTHNVTQYASVNVNVPASGIDTSDANAAAGEILSGRTAYVKGTKVTGTMANRGNMSATINGTTSTSATVSAGYYSGGSVTFDSSAIEALLKAI